MARPNVEQEIFLIVLSTFVYCSLNPIYAGAYRGYDVAAILDTNLATDRGKCGHSADGSSLDCADHGNYMIEKWAK